MRGFVAAGGSGPPKAAGPPPSGAEVAQVAAAVHALASLVRHIELRSAVDEECATWLERTCQSFSIVLARQPIIVLDVGPDALSWRGCEVWQDDPELAQLAGRLFHDSAASVVITTDSGDAGIRSLAAALVGAADPRHQRVGDAPTLAYRSGASGIGLASAFRANTDDSSDLDFVRSRPKVAMRPFAWALPPTPPATPSSLSWIDLDPAVLDSLRVGCSTEPARLGLAAAETLLASALRIGDATTALALVRPFAELLALASRTDDRSTAESILTHLRQPEVRSLCDMERALARRIDDAWLRTVIGGLPETASQAPPTLVAVLSTLPARAPERLVRLIHELHDEPRDIALATDLLTTLQGGEPVSSQNGAPLVQQASTSAGRAALLPLQHELARQRAPAADRTARLVRRWGVDLVRGLASSLHTADLLGAFSEALDERMERLEWTLAELANALGVITVELAGRTVAVDGVPLYFPRGTGGPGPLRERMAAHGCGRLEIHHVPSRTGLRHLVACLAGPPAPRFKRAALRRRLSEGGVGGIDALPPIETLRLADAPRPVAAQESLAASLVAAWEAAADGRTVDAARMRRAVVDLLRVGVTGDAVWSAIVNCDPPSWHGVSSTRLALLIGTGLDLSRSELIDLGVAVALRDVGYLAPLAPGEHSPETIAGDVHCQVGARLLLDRCGADSARAVYATVALQHHTPWQTRRDSLHPYARIAAVADAYANLTYGMRSFAPAHALALLASEAGARLDPTVVQLLVNQLGAYPPGSRVRTADGTQGFSVSVAGAPDRFARPRILVDRDSNGTAPTQPTIIDLADPVVDF